MGGDMASIQSRHWDDVRVEPVRVHQREAGRQEFVVVRGIHEQHRGLHRDQGLKDVLR